MRLIQFFVIVTIFCSITFPQDAAKIALIRENSYELIEAENQTGIIYVSLLDFVSSISIPVFDNVNPNFVSLLIKNYSIQFSINNPFVNVINLNDSSSNIVQLSSVP